MRLAALLLLTVVAVVASVSAEEGVTEPKPRANVAILAGLFDFTDGTYRTGELGAQYHGASRLWLLHPMAGGMATFDGAFNVYAGLGLDLALGERVLIWGSFAPGYYGPGDSGKDLGLGLEFRSCLGIAWRLPDGWRIGVEAYHLSNGTLGDINPGASGLLLSAAFPVGSGQ